MKLAASLTAEILKLLSNSGKLPHTVIDSRAAGTNELSVH